MKKQEAIKKLESLKMIGKDQRADCYNEAIKAGVLVIKQIDEPQELETVVFKHDEKSIVDWLEYTVSWQYPLYSAIENCSSDIRKWMKRDDNSNRFAKAFISAKYKLEKEPVWAIKNADGNYLTKCDLWGKDGVNYSFECNPSDKLLFTDKLIADAAALLVNGTAEQENK